MIKEIPCGAFIDVLAGKEPVPGGGGASALVGAVGVALGNMVGSLTVGKKKYADVEADIIALKEQATKLQEELLALADKDAEVFAPLAAAYGMPKETEEEKKAKEEVMEQCLRAACQVPLEIMRKCAEGIELLSDFARKGSRLAISDAGVGIIFMEAALRGASLNVFINTGSMKDRQVAAAFDKEAQDLINRYAVKAEVVFEDVRAKL